MHSLDDIIANNLNYRSLVQMFFQHSNKGSTSIGEHLIISIASPTGKFYKKNVSKAFKNNILIIHFFIQNVSILVIVSKIANI